MPEEAEGDGQASLQRWRSTYTQRSKRDWYIMKDQKLKKPEEIPKHAEARLWRALCAVLRAQATSMKLSRGLTQAHSIPRK